MDIKLRPLGCRMVQKIFKAKNEKCRKHGMNTLVDL